MSSVLPDRALLSRYRIAGAFADCYSFDSQQAISLAQFVTAFYTTPLFKAERLILKWVIAKPSTDLQARKLAAGEIDAFAAWTVEARSDEQLLMRDLGGRTRSWFMATPIPGGTRLYFGSAVVPAPGGKSGQPQLGALFTALLGFHKLYSSQLLAAARRSLAKS